MSGLPKNFFAYIGARTAIDDLEALDLLKRAKALGHDPVVQGNLVLRGLYEGPHPESMKFLIYECGINSCSFKYGGEYSDYVARFALEEFARFKLGMVPNPNDKIARARFEMCEIILKHPNTKKWLEDNFERLDTHIRVSHKLDFDIKSVFFGSS